MTRILFFSQNNHNREKIRNILDQRDDLELSCPEYDGLTGEVTDPSAWNLAILDLSGTYSHGYRKRIRQINGIFGNSGTARMLLVSREHMTVMFEDSLFVDDFIFLEDLEDDLETRIDFLLYRMKLVLPSDSLVIGDMVLNLEKYELSVDSRPIVLTYKEFEMFKLLLQNRDRVFTRIDLLSSVWGYDYYGGSRTVDVHMRRLRAKIPPPYNKMLKTIRNVGYMFSPGDKN